MTAADSSIAKADELKSELDKKRPLKPDVEERVLQKLRLWWNYHSNAIEGNKYTLGETEVVVMHGLTAKGKPLKDYLDITGHNEAITYLLGLVRGEDRLTEAAIRKLHEILLIKPYEVAAVTPTGEPTKKLIRLGQYKTEPNHVQTSTGEIHYYASPAETPALMHKLVDWYRSDPFKKMHPIGVAAKLHHEFTAIHPFDDGNGRLSRLLMNLILMQKGYPPAIFQLAERDQYLNALQKADAGDLAELTAFLAESVATSLQVYIRAADGKDIHDLLDLSKDIVLLKQSLRHIEDPLELSNDVQKRLFETSIKPLFEKIITLLGEIADLFRSVRILASATWGHPNSKQQNNWDWSLDKATFGNLNEFVKNGQIIFEIHLGYRLQGFRKAGTSPFDLHAKCRMSFSELNYSVMIGDRTQLIHLYQEEISLDEINAVAEDLVRPIVTEIRKRTEQSF